MKNRVSSFMKSLTRNIMADKIFMVLSRKPADSSGPAVSKLTLQASQKIRRIFTN